MRWHLATFLLVAAFVPHAQAQVDDSNGFDMGQAYRNQTPHEFSDESSTFPVEGQSQGRANPYPKYQFKNAGASKIIVPELGTGTAAVAVAPTADTTQPSSPPEEASSESPSPAAATGDAQYYQEIISKVKAQGETKANTSRDASKIADYKF